MTNQLTYCSVDLTKYRHSLKVKLVDGQPYLFDVVRKQWLVALPEEAVRQTIVQYLINEMGVRSPAIRIERAIFADSNDKIDISVLDANQNPYLLVECKHWDVPLSQSVINQTMRYHNAVPHRYCWVTNGVNHVFIEPKGNDYLFLEEIPSDYT